MSENGGFIRTTLTRDNLLANPKYIAKSVVIDENQTLVRGAVLGEKTLGSTITPGAGNTGDGVLGSLVLGEEIKKGNYVITCIATTGDGVFSVVDPDGVAMENCVVGDPYYNDAIAFQITAGATGFAVDDEFTITIAAGNGRFVLSLAAAVDGSEDVDSILLEDVTTGAGETQIATALVSGEVNERALTFGAGHDANSTRKEMRKLGIYYTYVSKGD